MSEAYPASASGSEEEKQSQTHAASLMQSKTSQVENQSGASSLPLSPDPIVARQPMPVAGSSSSRSYRVPGRARNPTLGISELPTRSTPVPRPAVASLIAQTTPPPVPEPPTLGISELPTRSTPVPNPAPASGSSSSPRHVLTQVQKAPRDISENTTRILAVPFAQKASQETQTTASTQTPGAYTPPLRRPRDLSRTLMLSGLAIVLLLAIFLSRTYLLGHPQQAGVQATPGICGAACTPAMQANASPITSKTSTTGSVPPADAPPPRSATVPASWKLALDDEFNGTGVNWKTWRDGGKNWGSGGNGEEQAYVPGECSVANGLLTIKGDQIPANGKQYSSCMLNTKGAFQQTYGYFEVRAKVPKGQGLWPAFWLYGSDPSTSAEIDVMETLGNDTRSYYMTYHYRGLDPQYQLYHGVDLAEDFHTYGVKWTPNLITFYFDGVAQYSATDDIYSGPMFLLLDLAIGGDWPHAPDASTPFPGYFTVDFIRVYAMA